MELYTRRVRISVDEFKFQGGHSGKTATSGPIYNLTHWTQLKGLSVGKDVCYHLLPEA